MEKAVVRLAGRGTVLAADRLERFYTTSPCSAGSQGVCAIGAADMQKMAGTLRREGMEKCGQRRRDGEQGAETRAVEPMRNHSNQYELTRTEIFPRSPEREFLHRMRQLINFWVFPLTDNNMVSCESEVR